MPNDCTNIITIICKNKDTLNAFIETELEVIRLHNDEHNEFIKILKKGNFGVVFKLWSPWNPDYDWLKNTLSLHPEFWIKNEWREEAGMAGVWVGFTRGNDEPVIESFIWKDLSIEEEYYFLNDNS
jgi:hypothetical protein